ncbi:unnamed protein product [Didymodactylos carnosus]|nr:unnamed protein product [Didymodactylos carnosus]CAF4043299.1 unnamed protein product [Didymodactylos carnosus]
MYIYERQLKFYYEKGKHLPPLIFAQLYDDQQKPNYYLLRATVPKYQRLFGCGTNADDYCNNNGLCIQNDELCPKQTVCLCNNCFYGSQCQYSIAGYAVSLDSIIGSYIIPNTPLRHQPSVIKLSLILLTLLLTIGLIVNSLSFLTFFLKSKTRDVGCGFYLLFSSLCGILTLLSFLTKFVYLLTLSSNRLRCTLIEYFLKSLPTISDWLNASVSVERATTILYKTKFNKKLSTTCSRYIAPLIACLVLTTLLHDPIYRQVTIDTYDQRSCEDFNDKSSTLLSYEKASKIWFAYVNNDELNCYVDIGKMHEEIAHMHNFDEADRLYHKKVSMIQSDLAVISD